MHLGLLLSLGRLPLWECPVSACKPPEQPQFGVGKQPPAVTEDTLSYITCMGATLVNTMIQGSSVRLCDPSSVHCTAYPPPKVQWFSVSLYVTCSPLSYAHPLPPGNLHAVVCVSEI